MNAGNRWKVADNIVAVAVVAVAAAAVVVAVQVDDSFWVLEVVQVYRIVVAVEILAAEGVY